MKLRNWLKNLVKTTEKKNVLTEEERLVQKRKLEATKNGEPFFTIVKFDIDPTKPDEGSFELDWNQEFVNWLRVQGYPGVQDEEVIDNWFTNTCRNVALDMFQQEMGDPEKRQIHKDELDDGFTAYS